MTVIAISGPPGAGSTSVAKLLVQKLGISYFSAGQLFKDLAKGNIEHQHYYKDFKAICENKNLILPIMQEKNDSHAAAAIWSSEFGRSKELHNTIDDLQRGLARKGNMSFDGKLAIRMIQEANHKIWVTAALDDRIKRLQKRDNLSYEEAKSLIQQREHTMRTEWQKIYGFNYEDQEKEADLVIDTSNLKPEQIVDKILSILNQ